MINFNEPVYVEKGIGYITEAILKYRRLNGDGEFTNFVLPGFRKDTEKRFYLQLRVHMRWKWQHCFVISSREMK